MRAFIFPVRLRALRSWISARMSAVICALFSILLALHSLVLAARPNAAVREYDTASSHMMRAPDSARWLRARRLNLMKNGQRELQVTARIARAR